MLGIQIGSEFLELPPGTTLELEKENPFLQFDENVIGTYSLPFAVTANATNNRLLNYAGTAQKRITNAGIDALLYDKSIQVGAGKVKVEKTVNNLNRSPKGVINCFYVSDVSGFWQDIKGMKLRQIDVGGDRSFAGFGFDVDTSDFGDHVKAVMTGGIGDYDYAFYPVQNSQWGEDPGRNFEPPVMNEVTWSGSALVLQNSPIVPFPYLKYVLEQAMAYTGWTLRGDILEDPDFLKITMINFRGIEWGYYRRFILSYTMVMHTTVTFNLKDNLPDMMISEFLIALKNRFGWWYECDNTTKTITIHQLKDLSTGSPVDMTAYSSPLLNRNISQENNIYSLRNNFITGGGSGADTSILDYQGEVDKTSDLPAPVEALTAQVYLVREENNYYICLQSEGDDAVWEWQILAANIYDYEPTGHNKEITTSATTVEMVRYSDYLDLIPRIDSPGVWTGENGETPWGIHLCFFYGMRDNKLNDPFPFASHHIYDSQGFTLAAWSLAFKAKNTDDEEVGLYDLNWKPFLDLLNSPEEFEHTLYLPLHLYLRLQFSDRIIIDGIELFIKQVKASIPYKNQVTCVSVRV